MGKADLHKDTPSMRFSSTSRSVTAEEDEKTEMCGAALFVGPGLNDPPTPVGGIQRSFPLSSFVGWA
jgi:hypothetical protein